MKSYKTIDYKGYNIDICYDNSPENPRSWCNAGVMCCWHSRYNLGDNHSYREPIDLLYELADVDGNEYYDEHGKDMSFAELYSKIEEKGTVILQLFLYDHSGISMSCSSYVGRAHHADWDSGPVGFIYITKDKIEAEGWTPEQAGRYLEGEVETYSQYLEGDVYGWKVSREDEDGDKEELDSCWGYYGSEGIEDAIKEAESVINSYAKEAQEEYEKQPKKKSAEYYTV